MTDKQYKESLVQRYKQTGSTDFIVVDETFRLTRKELKDKKREFKKRVAAVTPINEIAK